MGVIYTTYDTNFKERLKNNDIRYILCGLSASAPHRMFWVYERTEKFNIVLEEWLSKR